MIKTFNTADWHFHKEHLEDFKKSFDFFLEKVVEEKPDLIVIAGDLYDRALQNTSTAHFDYLIDAIKHLLSYCPIVTVYGTPSHDIPGSLKVMESIKENHSFVVLQPGKPYFLENGKIVSDKDDFLKGPDDLLILGMPEISEQYIKKDDISKTSDDVNSGVRSLITSYALIREQYKNIPCLLVFHGPIVGAKLSKTQALPPGALEIGWRDLHSIGADYVSCGHIHMAQRIGVDASIYYEGSFFPVSWGELTQKRFSIVEFIGRKIDRRSINLLHPVRQKIKIDISDCPAGEMPIDLDGYDLELKTVWLEITLNQTQSKTFNPGPHLNNLMKQGVNDNSRITTKVIKSETLRAKDITSKKTVFEKVKVYAENSLLEVPEGSEKICFDLEQTLRDSGFNHNKRQFVLNNIYLKGNKGVWKGLRKKAIEIDFDNYGPGTLAFLGDNGKGKSSIIKQCNPFADPLSGSGKLADDFYLKGSQTVVYMTEQVSGVKYKAQKDINGINGSSKYYLFSDAGNGWQPVNAEQTGRKDPYKKVVSEIFGSMELYKTSAFIAQKNNALPETPKARKELFNELIGNDYLQSMAASADMARKQSENSIISLKSRIEVLSAQIEEIPEKTALRDSIESDLILYNSQLLDLKQQGEILSGKFDQVQAEYLENEKVKTNIFNIESYIKDLETKKDKLESNVLSLKDAQTGVESSKNIILTMEGKRKEKTEIEAQLKVLTDDRTALNTAFNDNSQKLYDLINEQNEIIRTFDNKITANKTKQESNREKLISNNKLIEVKAKVCPSCGYIDDVIEAEIKNLKRENLSLENIIENYGIDNNSIKPQKEAALNVKAKLVQKNELLESDHKKQLDVVTNNINELNKIFFNLKDSILSDIEIRKHEEIIKDAETAETQIEMFNNQIAEIIKIVAEKNAEQLESGGKLNIFIGDILEAAKQTVEEKRAEYSELSKTIARIEQDIINLNNSLKTLEESKIKYDDDMYELKQVEPTINVYNFLSKALGRNGVQALELDAVAPTIAARANSLIERTFGSRYEIDFQTTKTNLDGSQAETFEISIIDHEEQEESLKSQSISTLSGGQERWFLKALFDAFGIIREENTGLKYLTVFQDEADGALSPEKKYLYLKMMEAAHSEAERHHTVYITHDSTIQQVIAQRIDIEKLSEVK